MSRYRVTDETRRKQHRGEGEGKDYVPWLKVGEFSNSGTASIVIDYKTGRPVHLMSQGEMHWWYYFRWDDEVYEIREQFPLDPNGDTTQRIANTLGIKHPTNMGEIKTMTTDLLVIRKDGTLHAYSVKYGRKSLNNKRTVDKLRIEKAFWKSEGVDFSIVFAEDLNMTYIRNIMDVTAVYRKEDVCDAIGLARHMIAHKQIICDMHSAPIDYSSIVKEERFEEIWKKENQLL